MLQTLMIILQVCSAIGVVALVLMQQGKGADAGAAFGSGASGTVFGSTGSANFLSRMTAWLATVFIACTVVLAFVVSPQVNAPSGVDYSGVKADVPPASTAPTAPAGGSTKSGAGIPQ